MEDKNKQDQKKEVSQSKDVKSVSQGNSIKVIGDLKSEEQTKEVVQNFLEKREAEKKANKPGFFKNSDTVVELLAEILPSLKEVVESLEIFVQADEVRDIYDDLVAIASEINFREKAKDFEDGYKLVKEYLTSDDFNKRKEEFLLVWDSLVGSITKIFSFIDSLDPNLINEEDLKNRIESAIQAFDSISKFINTIALQSFADDFNTGHKIIKGILNSDDFGTRKKEFLLVWDSLVEGLKTVKSFIKNDDFSKELSTLLDNFQKINQGLSEVDIEKMLSHLPRLIEGVDQISNSWLGKLLRIGGGRDDHDSKDVLGNKNSRIYEPIGMIPLSSNTSQIPLNRLTNLNNTDELYKSTVNIPLLNDVLPTLLLEFSEFKTNPLTDAFFTSDNTFVEPAFAQFSNGLKLELKPTYSPQINVSVDKKGDAIVEVVEDSTIERDPLASFNQVTV